MEEINEVIKMNSYPFFGQNNNINNIGGAQAQPSMVAPVPAQPPQNNYNTQSFFPQPAGNVYSLNTANDINNVPAGLGISVGLCLAENLIFIKALQNGSPMLLTYRLSSIDGGGNTAPVKKEEPVESNKDLEKFEDLFKNYDEKLRMLENQVVKIKERIGGRSEWQL